MSTLLIDMHSGISGDMLFAGLLALASNTDRLNNALSSLGYGNVEVSTCTISRDGFAAHTLHVEIEKPEPAPGPHMHVHYTSVQKRLAAAQLPANVLCLASDVYALIAEAEAAVHGTSLENAVFHEVGGAKAVVNVVGCCWLRAHLDVTRICATPILLGTGTAHCAHGRLSVPVPAVKEILSRRAPLQRHIPYDTGEITTPTGCALVCTLADSFIHHNGIPTEIVAYAAGKKVIPGLINLLRLAIIPHVESAS